MLTDEFIFDVCAGINRTFQELLRSLNNEPFYFEAGRFNSFYEFLVNFLKALINDKDIVLIDKDFSEEELKKFGYSIEIISKQEVIYIAESFYTKQKLIERISNSKSLITFFTSGTTGIPKKIVHTIPNLTRMVRVGEKYKNDVWAVAYNPTHMAGMQVILQALFNANKMVYIFEASLEQMKRAFFERKITHLSATPTFYRIFLSDKAIYPAVKRVTLGGEKSEPKLYFLLANCFPNAKINNIYASTELGSLFVSDNEVFTVPDSIKEKVRVIEYELMIHSSLLSWSLDEEWYKTGDLVEVISVLPLTFKFKSRKNEMINVGGYKVNPSEVEEAIRNFVEVREVRVFSKPNSVIGNILCAEIVLIPNMTLENNEIFIRLKEVIQEYKIPRIIKFKENIEVTRTGKLTRK